MQTYTRIQNTLCTAAIQHTRLLPTPLFFTNACATLLLIIVHFVRTFRLEGTVRTGQQTTKPENRNVHQQHVKAIPLGLTAPPKQTQITIIQRVIRAERRERGKRLGIPFVHTNEGRLHDPADQRDRGHPGAEPVGEGSSLEEQSRGHELHKCHGGDGDVGGAQVGRGEDHDFGEHGARNDQRDERQDDEAESVCDKKEKMEN